MAHHHRISNALKVYTSRRLHVLLQSSSLLPALLSIRSPLYFSAHHPFLYLNLPLISAKYSRFMDDCGGGAVTVTDGSAISYVYL